MRILIDISHVAHLNFFKYVIDKIHKQNDHDLIVTVLDRGSLMKIAQKELKGVRIVKSGKHRGGFVSILFEANVLKFFNLIKITLKFKPQIAFSCGGFVLGAIMKISGKRNIQFDDDPERKMNVFLERMTASVLFFPPIINEQNNIRSFIGLKEWTYLSPRYFEQEIEPLKVYNLEKKEYVFVRIINNDTLNYIGQDRRSITDMIIEALKGFKVVLSLEKKSDAGLFPSSWLILNEPVLKIHSLMYFSKFMISTGDSMAREGAMLGVPSLYCGGREMRANKYLTSYGLFFNSQPEEITDLIPAIIQMKVNQEEYRSGLLEEWDDINDLILSYII
jgi:uncharacterized protein